MKIGQTVSLYRDVAPSLMGVKVKIVHISALHIHVELLENAHGSSCWKQGDKMHVQPYNLKEES